ncbi:MAG: DUF3089 domain-containing protein [Pseudomonadota bacterium]
MSKKARFTATAIAAFALAALSLAVAVAFMAQDSLFRLASTPRGVDAGTPPPIPNYESAEAWIAKPAAPSGRPIVFYVHSTTYYAAKGWNAAFDGAEASAAARGVAAPPQAGLMTGFADLYAPHYRQATLAAMLGGGEAAEAALQLAYEDVAAAFRATLAAVDQGEARPSIILLGYGQGGLHVLRLLQDYFENSALRSRLAGAYVVDHPTPADLNDVVLRSIPICEEPRAVRCLAAWMGVDHRDRSEMRRLRDRSVAWSIHGRTDPTKGRPLICVNPLSWTRTGDYVPPALHLGAARLGGAAEAGSKGGDALAFSGGAEALSRSLVVRPELVGARCVDGILAMDRPARKDAPSASTFGARWKTRPFAPFAADIARNAQDRLAALDQIRIEETFAPPMDDVVIDIIDSPVNKVPD